MYLIRIAQGLAGGVRGCSRQRKHKRLWQKYKIVRSILNLSVSSPKQSHKDARSNVARLQNGRRSRALSWIVVASLGAALDAS